MAYYGGIIDDGTDITINEFEESFDNFTNNLIENTSNSNLRNETKFKPNKNPKNNQEYLYDHNGIKTDYKPGLIEKNELKEIQVFDPVSNKILEHLPTTVKIPTVTGDDHDIATKKLLTDKQKFLGIGQINFFIVIGILVVILFVAIAGLAVTVYFFISDSSSSYEWKLFGIISCGAAIIILIAILIFLIIYAKIRHKKYKKALYEELKDTDHYGNPIKTANLFKMYKHSRPIKPVTPPPVIKVEQKPVLVQTKPAIVQVTKKPVITAVSTPLPQPVSVVPIQNKPVQVSVPRQRFPFVSNLVSRLVQKPVPQKQAPLMIPMNNRPLNLGPQPNSRIVHLKKPITPTYVNLNFNQ